MTLVNQNAYNRKFPYIFETRERVSVKGVYIGNDLSFLNYSEIVEGTVLARASDGFFYPYDERETELDVAVCILFNTKNINFLDFVGESMQDIRPYITNAIFAGRDIYADKITNLTPNALIDLRGRIYSGSNNVQYLQF